MRIVRLKANKHADLLLVGDAANGPSVVSIATRLRPTTHGDFFKELVSKVTVEVAPHVMADHRPPTYAAKAIVGLCHEITKAAMDALADDPALAMTTPSYENLLHKLRGSDASQPEDSTGVVSLFERQEDKP